MDLKRAFMWAAAAVFATLSAGDFPVVENHRAQCAIVVSQDAPPQVIKGARELVDFIAKVTAAQVPIIHAKTTEKIIHIGTVAEVDLLKKAQLDPATLAPDSFAIIAGDNDLYVIGGDARGALYGCYEILTRYAGVNFLFPGNEGIYYTCLDSLKIPEGRVICRPAFPYRKLQFSTELAGMEFATRNHLTSIQNCRNFSPELQSLGVIFTATAGNSHILTQLMGNSEAERRQLFQLHPEYFPLIDGKRRFINTPGDPNPCVSNSGLLDLMAENLSAKLAVAHGAEDYIIIGNNDTTKWCQCENCAKLDDPERAGTRGARSDRYWFLVTEVAKRIWRKNPTLQLGGWAYQNFWYPPTKVKIDPKLRVVISFNNQCWKHPIGEANCPVNQELVNIMAAWRRTGLPLIVNREEIAATVGTPGGSFLPVERIWHENFRQYPELGLAGTTLCVHSPFPDLLKREADRPPYFGKNLRYAAMWQTAYLAAQLLWDADQNFDTLYEKINSIYYGKAWAGGYREFRQLLEKCFRESPDCIGYGINAPLARCLDSAGSEEKLLALLGQAELAAQSDSDPRALKHIRQAREIFSLTWLAARREYVKNLREISVYCRKNPIKIDGAPDEYDWQNADALAPLSVKCTYDQDQLYLAIEYLAPADDDRIEVELAHPANPPFRLSIDSAGKITPEAAQVAVKTIDDRKIIELAIPAKSIGKNFYPGATWQLNANLSGKKQTAARLKLTGERPRGFDSGKDVSAWKNAEFDLSVPDESLNRHYRYSRSKNWQFGDDRHLVPSNWTISADASGSWQPDFVQLTGGTISQYFLSPGKAKLQIIFRARGKGEATVRTCSYTDRPERNAKGYLQIKASEKRQTFALGNEWQTYTLETETCGAPTERVSIRFAVAPGSQLDLDEVYVDPTPHP